MIQKILFIHHGSYDGGAPLSMLYTMIGMRKAGYEPIAAIINTHKELHALYNSKGFRTIETPWIPRFITYSASEGKRYNPIVWKSVYEVWRDWGKAKIQLISLLKDEKIDIVHLNSVSLSNPASALMENGFPFVWHVREHGPKHKGRRFKFISGKLIKAKNVIFLSEAEKKSWVGNNQKGNIVHNFIDINKIKAEIDIEDVKNKLQVANKNVLLYVGGIQKHKGIIPLLKALVLLDKKVRMNTICLMPYSLFNLKNPKGKLQKKAAKIIIENDLEKVCKLLPFNSDISNYYAICDILLSPFTVPHFSRPIVEAAMYGKPSIATKIGPLKEQIVDGQTGVLVKAENPKELSEAISDLLLDDNNRNRMGAFANKFVLENFEYKKQMEKIISIYKKIKTPE